MVSFDVVNMFPNIPVDFAIKIINNNWMKIENYTRIKDKTLFIEGIRLCCETGYFRLNHKMYKQKNGIQTGNPLSVAICGIVMNQILNEIIYDCNMHIQFLYKYIDDTILAVDNKNIGDLLNTFNDKNLN